MSLLISPTELIFKRPLTKTRKVTLTLTNLTEQRAVAFKVKTNKGKVYSVSPNRGRIEPGKSISMHITREPSHPAPSPTHRCKAVILVQSFVMEEKRRDTPGMEEFRAMEQANSDSDAPDEDFPPAYDEKDVPSRASGSGNGTGTSQLVEQKIRCAYAPAKDLQEKKGDGGSEEGLGKRVKLGLKRMFGPPV